MGKMVGIIAPIKCETAENSGLNFRFRLKMKKTNNELTIKYLHDLTSKNYNIENRINANLLPGDEVPPAGNILTGVLRANNYNTMHSNKYDSLLKMAKMNPIAICISSTLIYYREALKLVINQIRSVMKDVIIIVGGPLIWKSYIWLDSINKQPEIASNPYCNNEGFNDFIFPCQKSEIDADVFIVSQHGMSILLEVIKKIEEGKNNFEDIPNLALYDNKGDIYFTPRTDEDVDYNKEYTRWDLLDKLPSVLHMSTSIGCPYRCNYCDFCTFHPKIKMRSYDSLLTELNMIKNCLSSNKQTVLLQFTDDNLFITENRLREVCGALIDSRLSLLCKGFIRADSINSSNISLIKQAGILTALIGVESGDQSQLDRMNKRINLESLKRGLELFDKICFEIALTFVVGFPGESETTIENTANFLNSLSVNKASFLIFPFVLTPLSPVSFPEWREKFQLYGLGKNWSHYTMESKDVNEYCFSLCQKISNIPFTYSEENIFYNLRLTNEKLSKIRKLRKDITVQILKNENWDSISKNFAEISETFGFGKRYPNKEFYDELILSI